MITAMVDMLPARGLELLAPARCRWCRAPALDPACAACAAALPWNAPACRACALPLPTAAASVCAACLQAAPAQDRSWAAFRYAPPVAEEILALKFHGRLGAAGLLGALMAGALARRPAPLPELLIPVPLGAARLRRRGYNQALEIGRALAARLAIGLAPAAARRRRETREQSRLDAVERRRNVRGAFELRASLAGRHVALLDDVITTGATAAELARAARRAGARRVEVWAAARVA
jgi:ComF family protein